MVRQGCRTLQKIFKLARNDKMKNCQKYDAHISVLRRFLNRGNIISCLKFLLKNKIRANMEFAPTVMVFIRLFRSLRVGFYLLRLLIGLYLYGYIFL